MKSIYSRGPWSRVLILCQMYFMSVTHGSHYRQSYFRAIPSLENYIIVDSALWAREKAGGIGRCTLMCLAEVSCRSVFYNTVTGSCIGHSNVLTWTTSASAASGSVYYEREPQPDIGTHAGGYPVSTSETSTAMTTSPTPSATIQTTTPTATTTTKSTTASTASAVTPNTVLAATFLTETNSATVANTPVGTSTPAPATMSPTAPTSGTTTTTTIHTTSTSINMSMSTTTATSTITTLSTTTSTATTTTIATTTPTTTTTIITTIPTTTAMTPTTATATTTATPTTTITTTVISTTTTTSTTPTTTSPTTTTSVIISDPGPYVYHHYKLSWDAARVVCQNNGGDLASLDSAQRLQDVMDFFDDYRSKLNSVANSVYAGMKRSTSNNVLYWNSGSTVGNITVWAPGYPVSSEGCGYTSPFENFQMRTVACTHPLAFLCETSVVSTTTQAPVTVSDPVPYAYHHYELSWDAARVVCQNNGGDLASLDSAQRLQDVMDFFDDYRSKLNSVYNSVYAGMKRSSSDNALYWNSGSTVGNVTVWAPGYPVSSEGCGYTSPFENFQMRTVACTHPLAFLCET